LFAILRAPRVVLHLQTSERPDTNVKRRLKQCHQLYTSHTTEPLFRDLTPCSLVVYRRFWRAVSTFKVEKGSDNTFRNVNYWSPINTASCPARLQHSALIAISGLVSSTGHPPPPGHGCRFSTQPATLRLCHKLK
jgi:hypothetical protein